MHNSNFRLTNFIWIGRRDGTNEYQPLYTFLNLLLKRREYVLDDTVWFVSNLNNWKVNCEIYM